MTPTTRIMNELHEESIDELRDILNDCKQVCDWYIGTCNEYEETEHFKYHPDPDAYYFLKDQAAIIKGRIDGWLIGQGLPTQRWG